MSDTLQEREREDQKTEWHEFTPDSNYSVRMCTICGFDEEGHNKYFPSRDQAAWLDCCQGYDHAPWCFGAVKVLAAASINEHQPAARGGAESELSVRDFDYHQYGDVTLNVTNNGVTVAIAYMQGRGREAKEWAEKVATAYNQHQALVAERDRLRRMLTTQAEAKEVARLCADALSQPATPGTSAGEGE